MDDRHCDPHIKLLFAACGAGSGSVDMYRQIDPDHYESAGQLLSGPGTRNGRFVPELSRYFLAVPQHDNANAEIRVYKFPGLCLLVSSQIRRGGEAGAYVRGSCFPPPSRVASLPAWD